jgi:hypothetical protein
MDIRMAVSEYVTQGKALLTRLQSYEGNMLTEVDLHMLRVQLHLIDSTASNMQRAKVSQTKIAPKGTS